MPKAPKPTTGQLILEGFRLKEQIRTATDRLKVINAELSQLPAGEHIGDDGAKCLIVAPSPKLKPAKEAWAKLQQLLGEKFAKLFERATGYKPVKSFRAVLGGLLNKREQKKVLKLVETEAKPYVKWGDGEETEAEE